MTTAPVVKTGSPDAYAALLEAPGLVAALDDVAVVDQPVQQRQGHLGVTEDAGPLAEAEVGRLCSTPSSTSCCHIAGSLHTRELLIAVKVGRPDARIDIDAIAFERLEGS